MKVEINPKIMLGKPVIKGTRITVEVILEDLSAGKSHAEILKSYPNLTEEGIEAALSFAISTIQKKYPLGSNLSKEEKLKIFRKLPDAFKEWSEKDFEEFEISIKNMREGK